MGEVGSSGIYKSGIGFDLSLSEMEKCQVQDNHSSVLLFSMSIKLMQFGPLVYGF